MSFWRTGPTHVAGHRGSPRRALENTFASFDAAEAEGVEGFELDVRLSLDGEVIVHHDPDIRVGERVVPLASLTMPEILAIPNRQGIERVLPLRDVFDRYGPEGRYMVEMKPGPSPRPGLLEFRLAALLTQYRLLEKAMVLSFSPDMLRRIRDIEPAIETGLNFDASTYRPLGQLVPDVPKGCAAAGPQVALATEELLVEAKAKGLPVYVWTVNDPEVARRLTRQGAAAIVTDVPGEIVPVVSETLREMAGTAEAVRVDG